MKTTPKDREILVFILDTHSQHPNRPRPRSSRGSSKIFYITIEIGATECKKKRMKEKKTKCNKSWITAGFCLHRSFCPACRSIVVTWALSLAGDGVNWKRQKLPIEIFATSNSTSTLNPIILKRRWISLKLSNLRRCHQNCSISSSRQISVYEMIHKLKMPCRNLFHAQTHITNPFHLRNRSRPLVSGGFRNDYIGILDASFHIFDGPSKWRRARCRVLSYIIQFKNHSHWVGDSVIQSCVCETDAVLFGSVRDDWIGFGKHRTI